MNRSIGWLKRLQRSVGAWSIAVGALVGSAGVAGCVVEDDSSDQAGGRDSKNDDPSGDAGDESNGSGGTSDGGGEGGSPEPGEGGAGGHADPGEGGSNAEGGTPGMEPGDGGEPNQPGTGSGVAGAEPGTWTYLVYLLADNDLEPFALEDLEELMEVGSGGKLEILVQIDRAAGESDDAIGGLPDFTSTKRVRVEEGRLVELEDLGELNLGRAETLSDFVTWGIQTSPSEHYALVLWDHGSAWPQFGADFSHSNDGLSLAELSTALDRAAADGKLQGPLDLVGFDACLMATWEVAAALQSRARYLLASEEVEPGHGWDHRAIAALREGADVLTLGRGLLDAYREQAEEQRTLARITLSLADLTQLGPLDEALGALTTGMMSDGMAEHATAIGRSRAQAPTFGSIPGGGSSHMTDLAMFAESLAELDAGLETEARAVVTALSDVIVEQVTGSAHGGVGGLSIFFPEHESGYVEGYAALAGVGAWREFLESFYTAAGASDVVPVFTNADKVADVTELDDGLLVEGQLAPGSFESLTSTLFDFGLLGSDGVAYFLGEEPADVSAAGLVSATWDTTALILSQGDTSDFGFYSLELASEDVVTLSVPFVYLEDGEETLAVLLLAFDLSGNVLSQGFYSELDGAWAELVTAPGGVFVSLVPALEPNASELGWIPQSVEFDASAGIDLEFVPLDSGTPVFVQLQANDFAGRGDAVTAVGEL